jgi:uncharacterized protein (TIGR04222 family)
MTNDTWGISGPAFLLAYLLVAVAVFLAATRARRALTDPRPDRPIGDLGDRPHDVAFLNGGGELSVYSALSAMSRRGTIVGQRGKVEAVGRVEPSDGDLEAAIHRAARNRVARRRLLSDGGVTSSLRRIEKRLVTDGLLLSDDTRRRHRSVAWWMGAVAVLGALRLLAGIAEARPVGWLALALLGVTVVVVVQVLRRPRRTRAGDRALAALRDTHHDRAPDAAPDWAVYGPVGAALAVGMYGTSALWASDPALAAELAVQRSAAGGDGGSAGYVGGGGGDGGSSGDGGGGGCGGGCGG